MASEYYERDNMLSASGVTPWHNGGVVLPEQPDYIQAMEIAHLNRSVEKVQMTTMDGYIVPNFFGTRYADAPEYILGVVTDKYTCVQNAEAFSIGEALTGTGKARVETAGTLKNGRVAWMLYQLKGMMEVLPGDTLAPYLLASTSHDGSAGVDWRATFTRVVCNNTLTAALNSGGRHQYKFYHTESVKDAMSEGIEFLKFALESNGRTLEQFRALAQKQLVEAEIKAYFKRVFPDTFTKVKPEIIAQLERNGQNQAAASLRVTGKPSIEPVEARKLCYELHQSGDGSGIPGVRGTVWGAFHAVTDYVDHHDGEKRSNKTDEATFRRMFGAGDERKRKAFDQALAMVG